MTMTHPPARHERFDWTGLASYPPSRAIMGWWMRPYAALRPMFWGDGSKCREPTHWTVADASPVWCGQASVGATRVKAIGSKVVARQTGRAPRNTIQDHGERGDIMTMRHAAPRNSNTAPRRPLKRSSEIILAAIIYLTASCFAVIGTLGIAAVVWTLWGTLGVR